MSPEALARLREALALDDVDTGDFWLRDLRALLEAYDRETQGGVPFVSREEDYRRGIAAERARVVADLRAEVKALREMKFCACGCEMPLAEALKERKNGYLNDEQAESLMPVRIGGARTNAEAARLERAADRIERGEHDKEST